MAKGLSPLQKAILEALKTAKVAFLPYRKISRIVADGTGGAVGGGHQVGEVLSNTHSAAFSRAVTRLEARGMVDRCRLPEGLFLSLTGTGRAWPEKPAPLPWQSRK